MAIDDTSKCNEKFLRWVPRGAWLLLLVGLFIVRLWGLGTRPLHNDEGVNYYFLGEISRLGYYPYSHENYHGPLYFYLLWICKLAPRVTETWLRLPNLFLGLAAFLPLLLVSRIIPGNIRFWMVVLGGLAASQVFYHRYAIHEPLFLSATSLVAVSLFAWHRTRQPYLHLWTGLGIGVLLTTKETWIVALFCLWFSFWSLGDWRAVTRDLVKQRTAIAQGCAVIAFIVIVCFSGGGLWSGGLREMLLAVPQWVDRGNRDVGHFKPFWYYLWMMVGERGAGVSAAVNFSKGVVNGISLGAEWYVWLFIPLSVVYGVRRYLRSQLLLQSHDDDLAVNVRLLLRYLAVWSLVSFVTYGVIKYKTPWLIINISFPLSLLLVVLVFVALENYQSACKRVLCLLASIAGIQSYVFCFAIPYGTMNPYSYVHSSSGLLDFVRDVEAFYNSRSDDERVVLAAVSQYWPLPFYLRPPEYNVHYQTKVPTNAAELEKFDILMLPPENPREIPGYVHRYYRLSDVQESEIYFRVG